MDDQSPSEWLIPQTKSWWTVLELYWTYICFGASDGGHVVLLEGIFWTMIVPCLSWVYAMSIHDDMAKLRHGGWPLLILGMNIGVHLSHLADTVCFPFRALNGALLSVCCRHLSASAVRRNLATPLWCPRFGLTLAALDTVKQGKNHAVAGEHLGGFSSSLWLMKKCLTTCDQKCV